MQVKRSNYFIPFKKDSQEQGTLGRMIRGAFVHQQVSGMYVWLPLGLRMLEKAMKIIEREHEKVGAQKLLMPILHEANLWKNSGRYQEYGPEMLKMMDRHEREFVYGPSAEEMFTQLLTKWPLNKNAFPMILYNMQWKFRDEIRPRFGVVRSREFLMKDAYSFDKTPEEMMITYEKMFNVYSKIFGQLGLNVCTFSSDVGIMGGSLSHEFVIKSEFGETIIEFDNWPNQPLNWNERDNARVIEGQEAIAKHTGSKYDTGSKYAEIGHIYALGQKYTQSFRLLNPENQQPMYMGCYGIGVSRLIAILFENHEHDLTVCAPFEKTIITIGQDNECSEIANKIFENTNTCATSNANNQCEDIIWDDRDVSYGIKCAEADLIGSPLQIHIGQKELAEGKIMLKEKGQKSTYTLEEVFNRLAIAKQLETCN